MSESRSALLQAAAEEFARHGPRGTRVQAIVARAGVNERMIYHHFGSKDGLYRAVLDDERIGVAAAWWPMLEKAAGMEPYEGMRAALAGFYEAVTARPLMVPLLLHEALGGWHTWTMPSADMLPVPMRTLYERGQRDGVFPAGAPFEVAYATAIGALFATAIFTPRIVAGRWAGVDLLPAAEGDRLRDQVVNQLLDGMTGPRSGPLRPSD